MPVKLPTKTPDAPPDKPAENKFDPFRPEMPQIPGVGPGARQAGSRHSGGLDTQRLLQIGGIVAAVVLIGAVILLVGQEQVRAASQFFLSDAEVADQTAPAPPLPNPIAAAHEGPTVAATVDELSKPWAAKKFTFVNPLTQENIDAMVIRLPGGELLGVFPPGTIRPLRIGIRDRSRTARLAI